MNPLAAKEMPEKFQKEFFFSAIYFYSDCKVHTNFGRSNSQQ